VVRSSQRAERRYRGLQCRLDDLTATLRAILVLKPKTSSKRSHEAVGPRCVRSGIDQLPGERTRWLLRTRIRDIAGRPNSGRPCFTRTDALVVEARIGAMTTRPAVAGECGDDSSTMPRQIFLLRVATHIAKGSTAIVRLVGQWAAIGGLGRHTRAPGRFPPRWRGRVRVGPSCSTR